MSIQLQKNQSSTGKLGTKRTCSHCTTKFYDMNKEEAECPKCETPFVAADATIAHEHGAPWQTKSSGKGDDILHHAETQFEADDFSDVGGDIVTHRGDGDEHNYDSLIAGKNSLFDAVEEYDRY